MHACVSWVPIRKVYLLCLETFSYFDIFSNSAIVNMLTVCSALGVYNMNTS